MLSSKGHQQATNKGGGDLRNQWGRGGRSCVSDLAGEHPALGEPGVVVTVAPVAGALPLSVWLLVRRVDLTVQEKMRGWQRHNNTIQ